MSDAYYDGPDGSTLPLPLPATLRERFLDPKGAYWREHDSGAFLVHASGASLAVCSNPELGFYLKLIPAARRWPGDSWLSLHDPSRLAETADAAEGWRASVGLFLPGDDAWKAVEEFSRTGQPSSQVRWIHPEDMPATGNW